MSIRPRLLMSRCLGFEACRYNGNIIREPVVDHLVPFVEPVTVCPEVEIGLGVPRAPIRLVQRGGAIRLLQPETELDVTDRMQAFIDQFVGTVGDCDGAVLKFGSPSCGTHDVKAYSSIARGASSTRTAGLFGGAILERFPAWIVEDEGRLSNFDIRHHFLTRLFARSRLRPLLQGGEMRDLIAFHSRHKLLLMAYNQTALRQLGRIVANPERRRFADVAAEYATHFDAALARAPRRTSAINVLMHALGYASDQLSPQEKAFFLESLEDYRERRVPLSVPSHLMRSWIVRFDIQYLAEQTFFDPYPSALVEVLDSGKGRSIR